MSAFLIDFVLSLRNWFIYLAMCLSLPSVLLYCTEIFIILRHKAFHNSFYSLFIVRAIPDLLYVIDSYYGYRLPTIFGDFLLPFYKNLPNWLLAFFYVVSTYTFVADNLATGFMLLNRLSAIVIPLKHENLWAKLIWPSVFAIFSVPLIFTLDSFNMNATLSINPHDPLNGNGTSFLIYEEGHYLEFNTEVTAFCSILFLIACMLINAVTLLVYRQKQRQLVKQKKQNGSGGKEAIERKLLVYAILTFVGHVLVAILMISLYFCAKTDYTAVQLIYTQYPWIVDIGTVVLPSWLLLWSSPTFRKQWAAIFISNWLKIWPESGTKVGGTIKLSNTVKVQPSIASSATMRNLGARQANPLRNLNKC